MKIKRKTICLEKLFVFVSGLYGMRARHRADSAARAGAAAAAAA